MSSASSVLMMEDASIQLMFAMQMKTAGMAVTRRIAPVANINSLAEMGAANL